MSTVFVATLQKGSYGRALVLAEAELANVKDRLDKYIQAQQEGREWATDEAIEQWQGSLAKAQQLVDDLNDCQVVNKRD